MALMHSTWKFSSAFVIICSQDVVKDVAVDLGERGGRCRSSPNCRVFIGNHSTFLPQGPAGFNDYLHHVPEGLVNMGVSQT